MDWGCLVSMGLAAIGGAGLGAFGLYSFLKRLGAKK